MVTGIAEKEANGWGPDASDASGNGYWRTTTTTTSRVQELDLGYSAIRICRPKFIWFECTGLRPNTPHWIFFNGVNVTRFIKTGVDQSTFNAYPKNSTIRNPGDMYVAENAYPTDLGGPTAASGPLTSTAAGSIYGIFYLQSNSTVNFPTGTLSLHALDISSFSPENAVSVARGSYDAIAQYQYYYDKTTTTSTSTSTWIATPTYNPPSERDGGGWEPANNVCYGGFGGPLGAMGNFQGPNLDGTAGYIAEIGGDPGGADGADGCFTKDTVVTMADGSTKLISEVKIGEYVRSRDGSSNKVTFVEKPSTAMSPMLKNVYAPKNGKPFATLNHPLWVDGQLTAINPQLVSFLYPWMSKIEKINQLNEYNINQIDDEFVYNLWVDGDGTYIVNGYSTHSIVGDGGFATSAFNLGLLDSQQVVDTIYQVINILAGKDSIPASEVIYGAYLLNKILGKIDNKYINKAMAKLITNRILNDENPNNAVRAALRVLLKGMGRTQLWLDGERSLFNKPAILKLFKSKV